MEYAEEQLDEYTAVGPIGGGSGKPYSDVDFFEEQEKKMNLCSVTINANDTSVLSLTAGFKTVGPSKRQSSGGRRGSDSLPELVDGPLRGGGIGGLSNSFYRLTGNGKARESVCILGDGEHLIAIEAVQCNKMTGGFMVLQKMRFIVLEKGGSHTRATPWFKREPEEGIDFISKLEAPPGFCIQGKPPSLHSPFLYISRSVPDWVLRVRVRFTHRSVCKPAPPPTAAGFFGSSGGALDSLGILCSPISAPERPPSISSGPTSPQGELQRAASLSTEEAPSVPATQGEELQRAASMPMPGSLPSHVTTTSQPPGLTKAQSMTPPIRFSAEEAAQALRDTAAERERASEPCQVRVGANPLSSPLHRTLCVLSVFYALRLRG